MKAGVLFSGGKDSTLALHIAKEEGMNIACLLSIIPKNPESYMFHYPNINFVDKQAEAMGIDLIKGTTLGKKEEELKDLKEIVKKAIKEYGIDTIVTGAIASRYQADRIKKIANDLSLNVFNPLWLKEDVEVYKMILERGFEVMIVGVYAYPLGKELLGKTITPEILEKLKKYKEEYKIHIAGEGGEIETFVLNAPLFKKRLVIKNYEIHYKNFSGNLEIKSVTFQSK